MSEYTQAELLNENFWDMFKLHKSPILRGIGGLARGITKGGEYLARTLAPEITQPLDQFQNWAQGGIEAVRQGMDLGTGGRKKMIADMLAERGWVLDNDKEPIKKGPNIVIFARRAIDTDENGNMVADMKSKPQPLIMDEHGNISNGAYFMRTPGKNPAYPSPSRKK